MPRVTQEEKLLNYLKEHEEGISFRDATYKLYILNSRDVIRRLKMKGYNIRKERVKTKNASYVVYKLGENDD